MTGFPVNGPVWFIGCGTMGGAILHRWLAAGLRAADVVVMRRSPAAMGDGLTVRTAPPAEGPAPALVVLAVKPQMLVEVVAGLAPRLARDTCLVSILAGTEVATLRALFPAPHLVVRAMPNTPVAIGRGVVALAADTADAAERARLSALFAPLGLVEWIAEAAMDAVTALAGSGPAFLFRFVDALAQAGLAQGLPADQAARMALATVGGAAALAESAASAPHELADRVASPGGSTRRGLDVLDAADGLGPLLRATIAAAVARNRELARLGAPAQAGVTMVDAASAR